MVDMDSKQGYIQSLPSKHSEGTKLGVQKFWADLKKKTRSDIGIGHFHSDDGKEFMGDLDEFLFSMGVTRTHTGGYVAEYNVIVEQRIKTLLGRMRANLHTAMGDNDYYDDLAGVALQHANHLINVVPWTNDKCPYETLTGQPYVMDAADKVFGSLVLNYRKKELRRSATSPVASMGIYVGRADEVPGGIWVVPIGYDAAVNRWVLDKPEISVDYKAYEGFFPLRTQPKEAGSTRTLNDFMDSTQPWFIQEDLGSQGNTVIPARSVTKATGVHEVEKILDRRRRKQGFEYYVQWKGYEASENTWEPARHFHDYGSRKLKEEFDAAYDKKHVQVHLCSAKNDDPAGRTTRLVEGAQDTLAAYAQDHAGSESDQSRQGKRREWSQRNILANHNAHRATVWHAESAAKWITSYAAQRSSRDIDTNHRTSAGTEALSVLGAHEEQGGEIYETVQRLMTQQGIAGDPKDFIPAYKKELEMKKIRWKNQGALILGSLRMAEHRKRTRDGRRLSGGNRGR